jgi:hypothetical protein
MPSLGHGISDAVRNHIPVWVDDPLIEVLFAEYKKAGGILDRVGFRMRIRVASEWVRKRRHTTPSGWEREYHCKTVQKATLIVHSPESDMSANGYVFYIDGKPVAGGKTKLKSTHVTQAVSRTDKTSVRPQDVVFVKFSEEELQKMRIQSEYGSDGFDYFESEREA